MFSICKGGIYEEFVNSEKISLSEGERMGAVLLDRRIQLSWPAFCPNGCLRRTDGFTSHCAAWNSSAWGYAFFTDTIFTDANTAQFTGKSFQIWRNFWFLSSVPYNTRFLYMLLLRVIPYLPEKFFNTASGLGQWSRWTASRHGQERRLTRL